MSSSGNGRGGRQSGAGRSRGQGGGQGNGGGQRNGNQGGQGNCGGQGNGGNAGGGNGATKYNVCKWVGTPDVNEAAHHLVPVSASPLNGGGYFNDKQG